MMRQGGGRRGGSRGSEVINPPGNDDEPGFKNPDGPASILESPWYVYSPDYEADVDSFYFIAWSQPHSKNPVARVILGYYMAGSIFVLKHSECNWMFEYEWNGKRKTNVNLQNHLMSMFLKKRYVLLLGTTRDRIADTFRKFGLETEGSASNRVDSRGVNQSIANMFMSWIERIDMSKQIKTCNVGSLKRCEDVRRSVTGDSIKITLDIYSGKRRLFAPMRFKLNKNQTFLDFFLAMKYRPKGLTRRGHPTVILYRGAKKISLSDTPASLGLENNEKLRAVYLGDFTTKYFREMEDCVIFRWGTGKYRLKRVGGEFSESEFVKVYSKKSKYDAQVKNILKGLRF